MVVTIYLVPVDFCGIVGVRMRVGMELDLRGDAWDGREG